MQRAGVLKQAGRGSQIVNGLVRVLSRRHGRHGSHCVVHCVVDVGMRRWRMIMFVHMVLLVMLLVVWVGLGLCIVALLAVIPSAVLRKAVVVALVVPTIAIAITHHLVNRRVAMVLMVLLLLRVCKVRRKLVLVNPPVAIDWPSRSGWRFGDSVRPPSGLHLSRNQRDMQWPCLESRSLWGWGAAQRRMELSWRQLAALGQRWVFCFIGGFFWDPTKPFDGIGHTVLVQEAEVIIWVYKDQDETQFNLVYSLLP